MNGDLATSRHARADPALFETVGAVTPQLTLLALWLLALVAGLALGVLWNRAVEKRARRADLPLEWRRALKRTYGQRHD